MPDLHEERRELAIERIVTKMPDAQAETLRDLPDTALFQLEQINCPIPALDDADRYLRQWRELYEDATKTPGMTEALFAVMLADQLKLRRLLAIRVAGMTIYGDDGELFDGSVRPYIDFLRDSPDAISAKLAERAANALT